MAYILDLDHAPIGRRLRVARALGKGEVVGVQSKLNSGECLWSSSQVVKLLRALAANVLWDGMNLRNQGIRDGLDGLDDTGQLDSTKRVEAAIIIARDHSGGLIGGESVLTGALLRRTSAAITVVHLALRRSLSLHRSSALENRSLQNGRSLLRRNGNLQGEARRGLAGRETACTRSKAAGLGRGRVSCHRGNGRALGGRRIVASLVASLRGKAVRTRSETTNAALGAVVGSLHVELLLWLVGQALRLHNESILVLAWKRLVQRPRLIDWALLEGGHHLLVALLHVCSRHLSLERMHGLGLRGNEVGIGHELLLELLHTDIVAILSNSHGNVVDILMVITLVGISKTIDRLGTSASGLEGSSRGIESVGHLGDHLRALVAVLVINCVSVAKRRGYRSSVDECGIR